MVFTVENSSKSLIGWSVIVEGFVNVYRGTGRVLLCPTKRGLSPAGGKTKEKTIDSSKDDLSDEED